jgi:hypothetical protein
MIMGVMMWRVEIDMGGKSVPLVWFTSCATAVALWRIEYGKRCSVSAVH